MDLVIDANILFATLVKEGITSRLFFLDNLHLYAPEFLLEEFKKYEGEIRTKTHRDSQDFEGILSTYQNRLTFIAKDVPYLVAAIKLGIPIWSNDKHLKEQGRVRVLATHELVKVLFPK